VRLHIGAALQDAALDPRQTGTELLFLQGRLYGLSRSDARRRVGELGELIDIGDALDRRIATYSGGMKRRLDLAAALIHNPDILFLDEPTTGLDPRSRLQLWETIEGLVADGTTVLLTTQYLDEADRLATEIAVIDHGRVLAGGTPDELKDRVGGERLEIRLDDASQAERAAESLATMGDEPPTVTGDLVTVGVRSRGGAIVDAVRRLDDADVGVEDIALRRPTLDDVFLALTGHATESSDPEREAA
jgi:ABC-2 type transport system ATP-binding protein